MAREGGSGSVIAPLTKTDEQLIDQASDEAIAAARPEPLRRAYDRLTEYMHPNYGSHVLTVRPHSVEAATVFIESFVAIYEAFLSLPWTKDTKDSGQKSARKRQTDSRDPFLRLANDTVPRLKSVLEAVPENEWRKAVDAFRACASSESSWANLNAFPTDVEAIQALRKNSVPPESWPEALRSRGVLTPFLHVSARAMLPRSLLDPGLHRSVDIRRSA